MLEQRQKVTQGPDLAAQPQQRTTVSLPPQSAVWDWALPAVRPFVEVGVAVVEKTQPEAEPESVAEMETERELAGPAPEKETVTGMELVVAVLGMTWRLVRGWAGR